jgi:hypothetical protein
MGSAAGTTGDGYYAGTKHKNHDRSKAGSQTRSRDKTTSSGTAA